MKHKSGAWVAGKVLKLLMKYRVGGGQAIEGLLYVVFGIAGRMGLSVNDVLELITERMEELDEYAKNDARPVNTKLDACGDKPVCDSGAGCEG